MSNLRTIIVALAAALAGLTSARADSGTVRISFIKAGWVIGGSVGSGTLTFRGRSYPLTVGGLSYGFTFGGSQTNLSGRVSNISRASDVAGVYGAAGAGAAIGAGAQAIVLRNEKGATLTLSGRQVGLIASADLSGLALALR